MRPPKMPFFLKVDFSIPHSNFLRLAPAYFLENLVNFGAAQMTEIKVTIVTIPIH